MAIIQLVLALVVLGFIYVRMIKREEPEISIPQAGIPVVLGAISVPLSFMLFMGTADALMGAGFSFDGMNLLIKSIFRAFISAGLPEEIAKLAFMILTIILFRSRIRNVYEYILIGAAVGMGFTLLEEFFYGSGGLSSILRLATVAAHMVFGIIMARHLGMAAYKRKTGSGSAFIEYVLALFVPIVIHTLYDAFTATSAFLSSKDDNVVAIGMALAIADLIVLFVLQFKVILGLKKDTVKYCSMNVK